MTGQAAQPTSLWLQTLRVTQNVCECVKGDSQTEGGTGGCLGCRADGWGLQDGSGIKGHSFPTGVCGAWGLARASQSFQQDLIRAEWALLKGGVVFYQRLLFHEPCVGTDSQPDRRARGHLGDQLVQPAQVPRALVEGGNGFGLGSVYGSEHICNSEA